MRVEKPQPRFVLCIRSEGSDDLETRKVYQVLPDRVAARDGYVVSAAQVVAHDARDCDRWGMLQSLPGARAPVSGMWWDGP